MRATLSTVLLLLATATATPAQRLQPPLGSQVQLKLSSERSLNGELLAVSQDSIWLLQPRGLASVPLGDVSRVRVDHGGMGASGALIWSLIAGVVSGVALQSACSSVSDADCGGVLPGTLLIWALIGAISAPSMQHARYAKLRAEPDSLRAHARFPQGLPATFATDSLIGPRSDKP